MTFQCCDFLSRFLGHRLSPQFFSGGYFYPCVFFPLVKQGDNADNYLHNLFAEFHNCLDYHYHKAFYCGQSQKAMVPKRFL